MESAVVMLSGGLGSTVAACRCRDEAHLHPLFLDYGRASAAAEHRAAEAVAESLGVSLGVIDLPYVRQIAAFRQAGPTTGPGLMGQADPAGPVAIDGLAAALLAVGAEYAAAIGAHKLITGQMAAPLEPGAQPVSRQRTIDLLEFHHAFASMLETAIPAVRAVLLEAPLIDLQPVEVVKLGRRFDAPFDRTWSCHQPAPPCGTCPGCRTRAAAFAQAGLSDPLLQPAGPGN